MSNLTDISDFSTPNYTNGRTKKIDTIVLHSMDGTYNGTISWFRNPDSRVSTHYLISKYGDIRQMVREEDTAWHAGVEYNSRSIGIELEDERKREKYIYPEVQIEALVNLIADIFRRYGELKIVLHKDISSNRTDPVGNFNLQLVMDRVRKLLNKPTQTTELKEIEFEGVKIPLDLDHKRAYKHLELYRDERKDGPEGNFEGYVRAVTGNDAKYSKLAGEHSQCLSKEKVLTDTINDLTDKIETTSFSNAWANLFYRMATLLENKSRSKSTS